MQSNKTRFVISLTGGLIEVFTNSVNAEVILCDWDCDSFDDRTTPVEFDALGEHYKLFVEPYPIHPLPRGSASFVGHALTLKGYDPVPEQSPETLSGRELASVFAALRYWQNDLVEDGVDSVIGGPHFQQYTPLNPDEIDHLCERLNEDGFDQPQSSQHAEVVPPADSSDHCHVYHSDAEARAELFRLGLLRQSA